MSAITGIFMRNGKDVDPELMKKMNDKLSHRGPDGSSVWCEGSVGLGHQMLWTTPESLHEKLPYEEDGLVITADARIDNRVELSKELGIRDEEDVADSYFILKAYAKWGEECPDKLLGDFAFAIWDKNKEKLFCARDHMGVKPFYYYLDDDMFVFGTEIKAIFNIDKIDYKINELKIGYFLMSEFTDKKLTFFENIMRLPSANTLKIKKQTFYIKKYWELNPDTTVKMNSEEDYTKKFLEIFTEAVNCRMRSSFPLGFELSGGLDSSSVVCIAKSILKKNNSSKLPINTFGISFKEIPQVNELPYLKNIIDEHINHYILYGDTTSPMENMKDMLWHVEQPTNNPYDSIFWKLLKKMEEKNIRILLTGIGGDEVISHGNYYLKDLAIEYKFIKLFKELKNYSKIHEHSFTRAYLNMVFIPFFPNRIVKWLLIITNKITIKKVLLNKKFSNKLGGENYLKNILYSSRESANTAKKFQYFLLNEKSIETSLEYKDKFSSAFNIEPRHPFLDKRLVEFCFSIPNEMKFRFGWGRYLQRISLENVLPEEIQWRSTKTRFPPIIERNLLLFERNRLKEICNVKNDSLVDYVNLEYINDIYQKYINKENYDSMDVQNLWLVISLHYWYTNINKDMYEWL